LRDLGFELRNRRGRRLVFRLALRELHLRHLPALEAQLEHLDRLGPALGRVLRDLELPVEAAQRDIRRGHGRHERQDRRAAALFASKQVRARGLGLASHLAEQVDVPRRRDARLKLVEHRNDTSGHRYRSALRRALTRSVETRADLREQRRTRAHELAEEFVDARRRVLDIEVVRQRRCDQLVEHRVLKLLPPLGIGDVLRILVLEAERRRHVHLRPHVVGAEQAAAQPQQQDRRDEARERGAAHVSTRRAAPSVLTCPLGGGFAWDRSKR